MVLLVAQHPPSHKRRMAALFDPELRSLRRDRAARIGPELFLHERSFADGLERLSLTGRSFGRALLIGCPDPLWPERLAEFAETVDVVDPGALFAARAGGDQVTEDAWAPAAAHYDLIVAAGTLDTVDALPLVLRALRLALLPDGLLIGAVPGGDTLPRLRIAMLAASHASGAAAPHVHPRIEAAAVAPLLESAGFVRPVVDIDRVQVSYPALGRLVGDLRAMGATNVLTARPRTPLSRTAAHVAADAFAAAGDGSRTTETFEILHFAAWTPAASRQG